MTLPWVHYYPAKPATLRPKQWNISLGDSKRPGSCVKTGSHTGQTPQFQGGLLLDGQGVEDYTKGKSQK